MQQGSGLIGQGMRAVKGFLGKLSDRAYVEHEQALLRVVAGLLLLPLYLSQNTGGGPWILIPSWGFVVLSVVLFGIICRFPAPSPVRRILGMLLDLGGTTYFMIAASNDAAAFYGIYLWVTLGNGFRYGVRYLVASQAVSIAGFTLVLFKSHFWSQNPTLGVGLMLAIVAVPLYAALLLKRAPSAQVEMRAAQVAAEGANEAKSRFVATISHEIRTPLNGIVGISDLLRGTTLNPEQQQLVQDLRESSQLLSSLISSVLDLAKIEAGKFAIEQAPFDLHEVVVHSTRMLNSQAAAKGLRLSATIDPSAPVALLGDALRLRQILINLIGNAVKFTEQGFVRVGVDVSREDEERVTLRFIVTDSGIGIPDAAMDRIFESFTQAHEAIHRRYGGSGLGITICKHLVERMGGRIGVESRDGKGAKFWFEIAFDRDPNAATLGVTEALRGRRAIVATADDRTARWFRDAAQPWGLEVKHVNSPDQLLTALMQGPANVRPCDVAVVDARCLPGDPERFAGAMGVMSPRRAVPTILLEERSSDVEATLNLGYLAVLSPTEDLPRLQMALRSAVMAARRPGPPRADEPAPARGPDTAGISVLVAEDNRINQRVLSMILQRGKCDVTLVETGEAAIDVIEERDFAFNLIILDMNMPGMRGVEVAKFVRFVEPPPPRRIPIIMLTAAATPEVRKECEDAGVDLFLTKPIEPHKVMEAVASLCRRPAAELTLSAAGPAVPDVWLDQEVLGRLGAFSGDPDFVAGLAQSFLSDAERLINDIEAALTYRRHSEFRELAHALKGSAGTVGAVTLEARCAATSKLSDQTLDARHDELIADLREAFAATREAMNAYAAEHTQRA